MPYAKIYQRQNAGYEVFVGRQSRDGSSRASVAAEAKITPSLVKSEYGTQDHV
jgi:hypothetical protein